jgi:hypothetical protein
MLSFVTLYFWRFLLMGRSASERHRLSRISACSMRHSPSSTSMAVYITRFSSPRSRSRLRSPMSASTRHTRYPRRAMLMPRLAEVVVLPTPPLPEVMTMTRASPAPSAVRRRAAPSSAARGRNASPRRERATGYFIIAVRAYELQAWNEPVVTSGGGNETERSEKRVGVVARTRMDVSRFTPRAEARLKTGEGTIARSRRPRVPWPRTSGDGEASRVRAQADGRGERARAGGRGARARLRRAPAARRGGPRAGRVDGGTQSEHRAIGRVNTEFPGRAESREAYERVSRGGDDAREGLRDRREVACAQLRGSGARVAAQDGRVGALVCDRENAPKSFQGRTDVDGGRNLPATWREISACRATLASRASWRRR